MSQYAELVKALRCKRDDCKGCDLAFFDKDEGWMCQYAAKDDDAADAIEALQAQLPKRGKWKVDMSHFSPNIVCSVCGVEIPCVAGWCMDAHMNYCPNCGAKMEVSE